MNNLDVATATGRAIGIAIGAWVGKSSLDALDDANYPILGNAFIFVCIVVVISKITEALVKVPIGRSLWLRQFVCGRDYIEGHWIDYTDQEGGNYCLLEISMFGGKLQLHGESYDLNWNRRYSWKSELASFDSPEVHYTFKTTDVAEGSPVQFEHGYSTHVFEHDRMTRQPSSYNGLFIEFGKHKQTFSLRGFRISSEEAFKARTSSQSGIEIATKLFGPQGNDHGEQGAGGQAG